MKTTILAFLLSALTAVLCKATEPAEYIICMEYMTTNIPPNSSLDYGIISGNSGLEVSWNIRSMPKPTLAELDAIKSQALAWKSNEVAIANAKAIEDMSDIDKMDPQLKSVILALVTLVNDRLPAGQKITDDQLKAAIKAEAGK